MNFEDFIASDKVRKSNPDFEQAKSLVMMSEQNFSAIQQIPLTQQTASILLSQAYESLRQVIEAICLTKGFKVYSHEAYTFYLKDCKKDYEAQVFDRLRRLRNGITYYGKPVSVAVAQQGIEDVKKLSTLLKTMMQK